MQKKDQYMRHDKSNEIQYHFAGIIITNGLMYKKNPGVAGQYDHQMLSEITQRCQ